MNYNEISSAFIRERLQNTQWKDHETIDELIVLDSFIRKPPTTWLGNMKFESLKKEFPAEYLKLLGDFSPEKLQEELLKKEEAKAREKSRFEQRTQQENTRRLEWLSAGGLD